MPQAKCIPCHTRYVWRNKKHRVQDARCPVHGTRMQQTSKDIRWPTVEIEAPRKGGFLGT